MRLSCKCGNESEFVERTVMEFMADGEGSREEKLIENTKYYCRHCDELAEKHLKTLNNTPDDIDPDYEAMMADLIPVSPK